MTDEQIFELMEEYFHLGCLHDNNYVEWFGQASDFVKFALAIHENGYNKGYDEGYERGFEYRDNFDKGYANRS
jgi:hypothetical protein